MHKTIATGLLTPLFGLALATAGLPTIATAGEAGVIPAGIYAMFPGIDPEAAMVKEGYARTCESNPLVVYPDGVLAGMEKNGDAKAEATGSYYSYMGTLTVMARDGDAITVKTENGAPGSGKNIRSLGYLLAVLESGAVTLVPANAEDAHNSRILIPCDTAQYDKTGPGERNYLDELSARPDGGAPLPRS